MTFTTLEAAALVLAVELLLVAWLGPFLLLRRERQRSVAEVGDAEEMLAAAEAREPSRREALETILSSTYHFEGEELSQKVDEFVEREQAFYHMMTRVYLDRDADGLKGIPEELTKVVSPWLRMTPQADEAAEAAARAEADALRSELDATRTQMDSLMREYQAAFDKNGAAAGANDTEAAADSSDETQSGEAGAANADDGIDLAFDTEDPNADEAGDEAPADGTAGDDVPGDNAEAASEPSVIKLDSDEDEDEDEASDSLTQDELDRLFSEEIDAVEEA